MLKETTGALMGLVLTTSHYKADAQVRLWYQLFESSFEEIYQFCFCWTLFKEERKVYYWCLNQPLHNTVSSPMSSWLTSIMRQFPKLFGRALRLTWCIRHKKGMLGEWQYIDINNSIKRITLFLGSEDVFIFGCC